MSVSGKAFRYFKRLQRLKAKTPATILTSAATIDLPFRGGLPRRSKAVSLPKKKEFAMFSAECAGELRTAWLPNLTDAGLDRLIEMLEKGSPFLIHGCFTKTAPMGCLASHAAWHHPRTAHLNQDAGITWLHRVAGLNPATSYVLREWDGRGANDLNLRAELLGQFRAERQSRSAPTPVARRESIPACV
jgi:hypothetical protein